jgi:hypothetical protein
MAFVPSGLVLGGPEAQRDLEVEEDREVAVVRDQVDRGSKRTSLAQSDEARQQLRSNCWTFLLNVRWAGLYGDGQVGNGQCVCYHQTRRPCSPVTTADFGCTTEVTDGVTLVRVPVVVKGPVCLSAFGTGVTIFLIAGGVTPRDLLLIQALDPGNSSSPTQFPRNSNLSERTWHRLDHRGLQWEARTRKRTAQLDV